MRVRRSGFALIFVLLAVTAVFALAMQGAAAARSARFETHILQQRLEASRTARSAAILAIAGALSDSTSETTNDGPGLGAGNVEEPQQPEPDRELPEIVRALLGDRARELEEAADETFEEDDKARRLAEGSGFGSVGSSGVRIKQLKMDSYPAAAITVQLEENGPRHHVWLQDATSLLNVNTAPRDQLVRFFAAKGITGQHAEQIAEQIIDWRDEDGFVMPLGAEHEQYVMRGIKPRNGRIESIEELLYLSAVDRETFELIAPDLALDGDGTIHAGTASEAVLVSIPGVSRDAAQRIIQLRSRGILDDEALDNALSLTAREAREILRTKPSNIILVRVAVDGEVRQRFEGIAILRDRGIASFAIRPTHRDWAASSSKSDSVTGEAG